MPLEEVLGDIFRDGEEVLVIIRGEDGEFLQDCASDSCLCRSSLWPPNDTLLKGVNS